MLPKLRSLSSGTHFPTPHIDNGENRAGEQIRECGFEVWPAQKMYKEFSKDRDDGVVITPKVSFVL